jgi:Ca-activated chloride channel family protein
MAAPLPFTDGEATIRFPLLVVPRYIPGVKLGGTDVGTRMAADTDETLDASRITPPTMVTLPGFPNPVQLSIEVRSGRDFEAYMPLWPEERSRFENVLTRRKRGS